MLHTILAVFQLPFHIVSQPAPTKQTGYFHVLYWSHNGQVSLPCTSAHCGPGILFCACANLVIILSTGSVLRSWISSSSTSEGAGNCGIQREAQMCLKENVKAITKSGYIKLHIKTKRYGKAKTKTWTSNSASATCPYYKGLNRILAYISNPLFFLDMRMDKRMQRTV